MNRRFRKRFRCGHFVVLLIVVLLIFLCLINIVKDLRTTKTSSNFEYKALSSAVIASKRWKSHSSEHKTTLITRRTCAHYYYLLILVSSAPANLDRRNNIRKTWASDKELKWPRWKTLFLLGQTPMQNALASSLLKEDEEFEDLVRADYIENYHNQTYKMQMGFEWAIRYCEFSFLLKVDDDVFVDTVRAISHLSEPSTPKKELFLGHVIRRTKPFRHKGGRWSLSYDEYGETFYPDYCSGFGFILSHDVVALFVEMFDFLPFFKIDDVYVGILAKETGIRARYSPGFEMKFTEKSKSLCIPFVTTLVRHGTLGECLIEIFNRSTANRMSFF